MPDRCPDCDVALEPGYLDFGGSLGWHRGRRSGWAPASERIAGGLWWAVHHNLDGARCPSCGLLLIRPPRDERAADPTTGS